METERVPSLHSLCCALVGEAVLTLENAPRVLAFARDHNATELAARAERFVRCSYAAVRDRADPSEIREALGTDAYASLEREQREIDTAVARMKALGTVVDVPPPPPPPLLPPQPTPGTAAVAAPASAGAGGARGRFARAGGEACARCGKRVYQAERYSAHGRAYHVGCFRCEHEGCGAKLLMSTFEVDVGGVLLCKPHFTQRRTARGERNSSGVSMPAVGPLRQRFGAGGAAVERCERCAERVYAMERAVAVGTGEEEHIFHRRCFRCDDCACQLTPSNYEVFTGGVVVCRVHHAAREQRAVEEEAELQSQAAAAGAAA